MFMASIKNALRRTVAHEVKKLWHGEYMRIDSILNSLYRSKKRLKIEIGGKVDFMRRFMWAYRLWRHCGCSWWEAWSDSRILAGVFSRR